MSMSRPLEDTFLILGAVEFSAPGMVRHKVLTMTKEEAMRLDEYLLGHRMEWAIVLREYDQEWLDNMLRPFMFAGATKTKKPVIYFAPGLTDITNHSR